MKIEYNKTRDNLYKVSITVLKASIIILVLISFFLWYKISDYAWRNPNLTSTQLFINNKNNYILLVIMVFSMVIKMNVIHRLKKDR